MRAERVSLLFTVTAFAQQVRRPSALFPPAYGVWREGNVFSLSVQRGGAPPGGTPNSVGHLGGTPQPGAPPGVPPQLEDKNVGQILGQKKLDKHFGNFWRWGGGRGRNASCGHAGGVLWEDNLVAVIVNIYSFVRSPLLWQNNIAAQVLVALSVILLVSFIAKK